MNAKLYRYVGPEVIRSRSSSAPGGTPISNQEDLRAWLDRQGRDGASGQVVATFVIDQQGSLWIADRRSEHVACARGGPVLSAGEMFFSSRWAIRLDEVSNLSTGFCPEPESWVAVARALDRMGVDHPGRFTTEIMFRRCHGCGERNVVKDGWFTCEVCGGELPKIWNFDVGPDAHESGFVRKFDAPYQRTIAEVRGTLTTVFAEVDAWFDRPEEVRAFRPSDGGWTIDEVLEHVTLTNHYLLLVIRKSTGKALARAARGEPVGDGESDLRLLDPIGVRGSFAWPRPDHMVPTGQTTAEEIRSLLRHQVQECHEILGRLGRGEGSLHRVRMSVNDSGRLDIYQWFIFLAQHARRHLAQMAANEVAWQRTTGTASSRLV